MPRFKKLPVEVEAYQLQQNAASQVDAIDWIKANGHQATAAQEGINIYTLEGVMLASWGDYIIQGVQGEFYPCKPDIFEATYEKIRE